MRMKLLAVLALVVSMADAQSIRQNPNLDIRACKLERTPYIVSTPGEFSANSAQRCADETANAANLRWTQVIQFGPNACVVAYQVRSNELECRTILPQGSNMDERDYLVCLCQTRGMTVPMTGKKQPPFVLTPPK